MKFEKITNIAPIINDRVEPYEGERPYLSTGGLNGSEYETVDIEYINKPSRADLTVSPDDVFMARMQYTPKVFQATERELDLIISTGFVVFRPEKGKLHPRYLYHYLKANRLQHEKDKRCTGATQKAINNSKLDELEIPLPSYDYQTRVAEILDKADALRQKRKESIKLLDDFLRSTFLEMFGDPMVNPKGWEKRELMNIGEVITGNTPSRKNKKFYGDHLEWVKTNNINTNQMYVTPAKESLSELGELNCRTVPKHSILVTCIAGSKRVIGNAAVTDRKVAINQQINALVPNVGNPFFLYYQFLIAKKYIQTFSTDSMKGMINKSNFKKIEFCYPGIQLQDNFGDMVIQVEKLKAKYIESEKELDNLFGSLMQRAFNGEL